MAFYAIYNNKDECVCVGNVTACAKYLSCKEQYVYDLRQKTKAGLINGKRNYKVYKIEEEENE